MSTSNKIAVKTNASSAKRNAMYCKVCADAKKPADVIASHNVKDASGKNTCPTLASQSCKYCKEVGHTVKYCKSLAEKNKIAAYVPPANKPDRVVRPDTIPNANGFSALYQDSEEEEEEEEHESFPALSMAKMTQTRSNITTISYASALISEKTKSLPVAIPVALHIPIRIPTVEYTEPRLSGQTMKKSRWLDADSSSDEEEDEDEVEMPIPCVQTAETQQVCECAW
jgi:hypothetical protein